MNVFLTAVAPALRREQALFLAVATLLASLLKTDAGPPLFDLVRPSCYEGGNFHP
jgi:hypothetical protein